MAAYQLRCQVFGHEKDVRAVTAAINPDNAIISGSRDVTARVWVPEEGSNNFHEGHCMSGHSNFVASVCCLPQDDNSPHGLIFTGSNDSTILAFTLESPQPIFKLEGHSSTVCALAAGKFGTLLSGSWDKTAKVWLGQKCVMTLEGHESAVWAVAIMPEHGVMLTGSADKTIKVWKAGKCEKTIKGHDDCVRGLAVTQGNEFLSCSNDATIRRWLLTGDCIAVYYGHENFVYSIAVLPNGQDFVSSGEDRTVRVWRDGQCKQTINHPTISIWTVCTLANGDIVSGASDGVVRVFTCEPGRYASAEEMKMYDEQIAASQVPADIKPELLPGPEALDTQGTKDGQTKIVKNASGKVELYSWDTNLLQWKKIGDVVGSSGGTNATSGKTLHEGKEYDYVFSVDIEEGKPPIKLPYNIAEDPYFAAQNFLNTNQLSQLFLDQVAGFIIENTKGVTLGQGQPAGFADPFTGGNRYVPGSDSGPAPPGSDPFTGSGRYIPGTDTRTPGVGQADPFTGTGRYVPTYNETQRSNPTGGGGGDVFTGAYTTGSVNPNLSKSNEFFPKTTTITFDAANPAAIVGKLKEFNGNVELEASKKIEEENLNKLEGMMKQMLPTDENLNTVKALLQWPPNFIFPALDVLRIVIKFEEANMAFCINSVVLDNMIQYWTDGSAGVPNQILSLKVVSNMFAQPQGFKLCMESRDKILSSALTLKDSKNKNVQIGLSTVILNFSVGLFGSLDLEGKSQTIATAVECLKSSPDAEAAFRLFIAMGTLIHKDETVLNLAQSMDVVKLLDDYIQLAEPKKVSQCAIFLKELLC